MAVRSVECKIRVAINAPTAIFLSSTGRPVSLYRPTGDDRPRYRPHHIWVFMSKWSTGRTLSGTVRPVAGILANVALGMNFPFVPADRYIHTVRPVIL